MIPAIGYPVYKNAFQHFDKFFFGQVIFVILFCRSKFVYGEDALFYWVCKMDAKTCAWCRSQARSEPRPIDEWELDHPYGRCNLKPVKEEFSSDYKLLVGIV